MKISVLSRIIKKMYGSHNRLAQINIGRLIRKFLDTVSVEEKKIEKYGRSSRSQKILVPFVKMLLKTMKCSYTNFT